MTKPRHNAYDEQGLPKYLRIYDNDGRSVDRYTVVYTQVKSGEQFFLAMSEHPFHPQRGVCLHDSVPAYKPIDRPRYGHLGKKIKFIDLNENCQKAVMQDYIEFWPQKEAV